MRDLNRYEVAAMWLWGAEYARQGLGAIEFYASLSESRKQTVREMVREILAAGEA